MKPQQLIKLTASVLAAISLVGCTGQAKPNGEPADTQPDQHQTDTQPVQTAKTPQQIVEAYAAEKGIPAESWPTHIVALIEKNPEMLQYVLDYPFEYGKNHEIDLSEYAQSDMVPLFMQWDKRWGYIRYGSDLVGLTGCGPTCLAMVAYYYTKDSDMNPARMVQFAKDNDYYSLGAGSAWALISEGAGKLGLQAKALSLSEYQLRNALESGKPVIAAMGPGIFTSAGHYIVFVACEDGKYRVNDPNSRERSEKLWEYDDFQDQVRNWWAISLA